MRVRKSIIALISTSVIALGAEGANLKPTDKSGNADAGREFTLVACTGCQVVAANQPFAPLLTGAPDFVTIANRPDVTAASLHRRLTTLPHIPSKGQMGNPELDGEELANAVAYIMSMREQRADYSASPWPGYLGHSRLAKKEADARISASITPEMLETTLT
jgi:hypothetical protein